MAPEVAQPTVQKPPPFENFFLPPFEGREKLRPGNYEKIIVISDLHGSKPNVIERLKAIPRKGENKPTAVILEGDVIGNPELETLQKMFYNGVINPAREALGEDSKINNSNLLARPVEHPSDKRYTLKDAFIDLRIKELQLADMIPAEISEEERRAFKGGVQDEDVAGEIRRYAESFVHYGHYVSNLPEEAVKKLANGLRENAERLAEPLKALKESGVKVIVTAGNWDPSPPIAFKRGIAEAQRLSPEEQQKATGFSTKNFFAEQGIDYVTDMHVFETETAAMVLLPFDQLVRYADMEVDAIREQEADKLAIIEKARKAGKQVIVVQHGEVLWEPHHLNKPHIKVQGEHEKVINGSSKINRLLKPDEVLHGHIHDPFVTEDGEKLDPNTKYAVVFDAGKPVVIHPKDHAEGQTVVSYIQLQSMATVLIPRATKERRISGFGGQRQPAYVEPMAA